MTSIEETAHNNGLLKALKNVLESKELPELPYMQMVWIDFRGKNGYQAFTFQQDENEEEIVGALNLNALSFPFFQEAREPLILAPNPLIIEEQNRTVLQTLFPHLPEDYSHIIYLPVVLWSSPIGYLAIPVKDLKKEKEIIFHYLHPFAESAGYCLVNHLLSYFDEAKISSYANLDDLAKAYIDKISYWSKLELAPEQVNQSYRYTVSNWEIELSNSYKYKLVCPHFSLHENGSPNTNTPLCEYASFQKKRELLNTQLQLVFDKLLLIWEYNRGNKLFSQIRLLQENLQTKISTIDTSYKGLSDNMTKIVNLLKTTSLQEDRKDCAIIKKGDTCEIWFNYKKVYDGRFHKRIEQIAIILSESYKPINSFSFFNMFEILPDLKKLKAEYLAIQNEKKGLKEFEEPDTYLSNDDEDATSEYFVPKSDIYKEKKNNYDELENTIADYEKQADNSNKKEAINILEVALQLLTDFITEGRGQLPGNIERNAGFRRSNLQRKINNLKGGIQKDPFATSISKSPGRRKKKKENLQTKEDALIKKHCGTLNSSFNNFKNIFKQDEQEVIDYFNRIMTTTKNPKNLITIDFTKASKAYQNKKWEVYLKGN